MGEDTTIPESEDAGKPIDLGLSVLWANYNVGASNPEEDGDYFAWGETQTKSTFTLNNY